MDRRFRPWGPRSTCWWTPWCCRPALTLAPSSFRSFPGCRRQRRERPAIARQATLAVIGLAAYFRHCISIRSGQDYFFETTLGGHTITSRLAHALATGHEVRIWYAGLSSPELHIARVAARVRDGGHDIPERDIRCRFDNSRRNLISLLPRLTELDVCDNSAAADRARRLRQQCRG